MVNPLEMTDTVGERRERERDRLKVWGGIRDQMEVCFDDNGFLRRGKIIWLDLHRQKRPGIGMVAVVAL